MSQPPILIVDDDPATGRSLPVNFRPGDLVRIVQVALAARKA